MLESTITLLATAISPIHGWNPKVCARPGSVHQAVLYCGFSLIPQTSTTRPPQVRIWGSLVVESRKNGHFFRGIIWWDYLVGPTGFSPARPWPPHPARCPAPSAAATPRRTAELHSPPARSVSLSQVNGPSSIRFHLLLKPQVIPPRKLPTPKANVQGTYFAVAYKWHHISPLRRCQGQPRRHLRWSAAFSRPSCTEDHQTVAPVRR
jgi:hypothetical protein